MAEIPGIGPLGNVFAPIAKSGPVLLWLGVGLVSVLIVGIIVYLFYLNTKKYYIKTVIISRRAGAEGAIKTFIDKSGIFKYKNSEVLRVRGRRKNYPVPDASFIYPDNTLYMEETTLDNLIPVRIELANPKLKTQASDQDMKLWHALEVERWESEFKKVHFWDRYGNLISIAILAGVIIVALALLTRMMSGVIDVARDVMAQAAAQSAASTPATIPAPSAPY